MALEVDRKGAGFLAGRLQSLFIAPISLVGSISFMTPRPTESASSRPGRRES